jgi:hypothetical protein
MSESTLPVFDTVTVTLISSQGPTEDGNEGFDEEKEEYVMPWPNVKRRGAPRGDD